MKEVEVKKKITKEFLQELHEKAKTLEGEEKEQLMKVIVYLSKNIGSYLVK